MHLQDGFITHLRDVPEVRHLALAGRIHLALAGRPGSDFIYYYRNCFDESDPLIKHLLTKPLDLHIQGSEDKSNTEAADAYREQLVQKSLAQHTKHLMKGKSHRVAGAADKRHYKTFYPGLKAVYGPHTHRSERNLCTVPTSLVLEIIVHVAASYKESVNTS